MQDDYDYYEDQDSFLFGDGIDTDPDPTDRETMRIESTLEWALEELEEMIAAVRKFLPDRSDMSDDQVVRCVREWLREFGSADKEADMDLVVDAMPLLHVLRSGISVSKGFNYVGEHSLTIGPNIPSIPSLGIAGCGFDFDQNPYEVLEAAQKVNDLAQILWIRGSRIVEKSGWSAAADSEGNYIPMDPDGIAAPDDEQPAVEEPAVEEPAGEATNPLPEGLDGLEFLDWLLKDPEGETE